ncbi:hypothetical protein AVEN_126879-1 [Araneus ventricosus]|uniref:ATP-dependent DNA helicase n=1 Tax=Araneus ventricosus TaxID=182803 RepID=A0A4Y2C0G1_ARAVE|nr:hypothetical protein AVEN_126879-1 [Araneus ventricosus]
MSKSVIHIYRLTAKVLLPHINLRAAITIATNFVYRYSKDTRCLKDCKLIVWDECTMFHKAAFEALDVTLKDVRRSNNRMGGVIIVHSIGLETFDRHFQLFPVEPGRMKCRPV